MNCLVSIVVPLHNCEQTIEKCVRSILDQTYRAIEILLIENGSTDNTYQLAQEMSEQDNRIKLARIAEANVTAARGEGIQLAQGDWVCFCDCDDWIEPDAVDKLTTQALSSGSDIVDAGYSKRISPFFPKMKTMIPADILNGGSVCTSCLAWCDPIKYHQFSGLCGSIYKRDLFDKIPDGILRSGLRRGEDILVNAYLHMIAGKCMVLPDALYNYRVGGVTSGNYRLLDDLIAREGLIKKYIMPFSDNDVTDVELENAIYVLREIELRYKHSWAVGKKGQFEFYDAVLNDRRIHRLAEIVRTASGSASLELRYSQLILDGDLNKLMNYEMSKYGISRIVMILIGRISGMMRKFG